LSKILSSSGLGLEPDEVGQKGLKLPHLKILFHCRLEGLPSLLRVQAAL